MPAMDYSQVTHWYDIYVKTNIDIPFFLNETRHKDRVLELTSGTSRLSIPLIEAGVSLTCVDIIPRRRDEQYYFRSHPSNYQRQICDYFCD